MSTLDSPLSDDVLVDGDLFNIWDIFEDNGDDNDDNKRWGWKQKPVKMERWQIGFIQEEQFPMDDLMNSGGRKAPETCWSAWSSSWRPPARRWCSATYSRCLIQLFMNNFPFPRIRGWPRGGSRLWPPRTSLMLSRWRPKLSNIGKYLICFRVFGWQWTGTWRRQNQA